jgi:hypothetical protein
VEVVAGETSDSSAESETTEVADTQPETPKDEWTIYTEGFIERYQFHSEQKQKAFAMLRQQQERRDDYLRNNVGDMARVTKMLTEAKTDEEREKALAAYQRLNAPVNRMFEQLKERLDTLPTRAQRKAAAEAERAAEGGTSKPAEGRGTEAGSEKLEALGYTEPAEPEPEPE